MALCPAYQDSLPRAPASSGAGGGSVYVGRMTLIPALLSPEISSFKVRATACEAPGAYTAVGALGAVQSTKPGSSPYCPPSADVWAQGNRLGVPAPRGVPVLSSATCVRLALPHLLVASFLAPQPPP